MSARGSPSSSSALPELSAEELYKATHPEEEEEEEEKEEEEEEEGDRGAPPPPSTTPPPPPTTTTAAPPPSTTPSTTATTTTTTTAPPPSTPPPLATLSPKELYEATHQEEGEDAAGEDAVSEACACDMFFLPPFLTPLLIFFFCQGETETSTSPDDQTFDRTLLLTPSQQEAARRAKIAAGFRGRVPDRSTPRTTTTTTTTTTATPTSQEGGAEARVCLDFEEEKSRRLIQQVDEMYWMTLLTLALTSFAVLSQYLSSCGTCFFFSKKMRTDDMGCGRNYKKIKTMEEGNEGDEKSRTTEASFADCLLQDDGQGECVEMQPMSTSKPPPPTAPPPTASTSAAPPTSPPTSSLRKRSSTSPSSLPSQQQQKSGDP